MDVDEGPNEVDIAQASVLAARNKKSEDEARALAVAQHSEGQKTAEAAKLGYAYVYIGWASGGQFFTGEPYTHPFGIDDVQEEYNEKLVVDITDDTELDEDPEARARRYRLAAEGAVRTWVARQSSRNHAKFTLGVYNPRNTGEPDRDKLVDSLIKYGVRNDDPQHAFPVGFPRDKIMLESLTQKVDPASRNFLREAGSSDDPPYTLSRALMVDGYGGRHRLTAIDTYRSILMVEINVAKRNIEFADRRIRDNSGSADTGLLTIYLNMRKEWVEEMKRKQTVLSSLDYWLCEVYDIGAQTNSPISGPRILTLSFP